jgi:hypothetical protein
LKFFKNWTSGRPSFPTAVSAGAFCIPIFLDNPAKPRQIFPVKRASLVLLVFLADSPVLSAFRFIGQLNSAYYFYQNKTTADSSLNHIRQYQSLSFMAADFGKLGKGRGFQLAANARLRSDYLRGPEKKAQLNFYNLSLGYDKFLGKLDWKLGRQFIAFPTLGVNVDALALKSRLHRKLELSGFYGAFVNPLFPDRVGPFKENQTWGMAATLYPSPYLKIKAAYGARFFNGRNRFRGGSSEFSFLHRGWSFYGKAVYDRRTEQLVSGIFRLTLPPLKKLFLQAEGASYRPVFYQNSIFPRFKIARYTDLRLSGDYSLSDHISLFGQTGAVLYEDETGYRAEAGLRSDPFFFGYRRTGGLGRSFDGVFSQFTQRNRNFTFTAGFDLSQFQLEPDTAGPAEEETRIANFLMGIGWHPYRSLSLEVTYQVLSNPDYRYDNRLFLRAGWRWEVRR